MQYRTDGLLRGCRSERCEQTRTFKNAEWNLDTLLELHTAFLDHGTEVNEAAIEALRLLAEQNPEPFKVSPVMALGLFRAKSNFKFLLSLGTPEADAVAQHIFMNEILQGSNWEFEQAVKDLVELNKRDLLAAFQTAIIRSGKMSEAKAKILRRSIPY